MFATQRTIIPTTSEMYLTSIRSEFEKSPVGVAPELIRLDKEEDDLAKDSSDKAEIVCRAASDLFDTVHSAAKLPVIASPIASASVAIPLYFASPLAAVITGAYLYGVGYFGVKHKTTLDINNTIAYINDTLKTSPEVIYSRLNRLSKKIEYLKTSSSDTGVYKPQTTKAISYFEKTFIACKGEMEKELPKCDISQLRRDNQMFNVSIYASVQKSLKSFRDISKTVGCKPKYLPKIDPIGYKEVPGTKSVPVTKTRTFKTFNRTAKALYEYRHEEEYVDHYIKEPCIDRIPIYDTRTSSDSDEESSVVEHKEKVEHKERGEK